MDTTSNGVRRARRRRWPWHVLAPAALVLSVGGVLLVNSWHALRPVIDVRVVPAVFAPDSADAPGTGERSAGGPAVTRNTGVTVQAPGWLEADPYITACSALADGVVQSIEVLEGQAIEAGQVVARLVPDDAALALRGAEANAAVARAEVGVAQANVLGAQSDWDHPIERRRAVATAEANVAQTRATLAQLPALVASDEATLAGQREELARAESALQSGAATDIEVIILRKKVEAQAASLQALRDREGILRAQLDRELADLEAAKRNDELRIEERRALDAALAGAARAEAALLQAQAALDEARLRMERMVIRAPMSGLVQRRLKSPGDKVMLGMDEGHSSHIVHIYDPRRLQVRVDVPLADAAHVFVGQRCEVVVDVLPESTYAGEVTRITNEADLQKNTLQVKVRVIDPSAHFRPEMLTRVKFLGDVAGPVRAVDGAPTTAAPADRAQLLVPRAGLVEQGGAASVLVVRDRRGTRGKLHAVDVRVDATEGDWARVAGALRMGDLVVVAPPDLAPGTIVRARAMEGGAS